MRRARQALEHLGRPNVALALQREVLFDRHHLDETDEDFAVARQGREVAQLVVVVAAHHDAVEFHRLEARRKGRVDAGQHALESGPARDRVEAVGAQRVERNVDPAQPAARSAPT